MHYQFQNDSCKRTERQAPFIQNSVAFSPQEKYTDWSTVTCWRNLVPTFAHRRVSRHKILFVCRNKFRAVESSAAVTTSRHFHGLVSAAFYSLQWQDAPGERLLLVVTNLPARPCCNWGFMFKSLNSVASTEADKKMIKVQPWHEQVEYCYSLSHYHLSSNCFHILTPPCLCFNLVYFPFLVSSFFACYIFKSKKL
jgi:hypothetical protein